MSAAVRVAVDVRPAACPTCGRGPQAAFDQGELRRQTYLTVAETAAYIYGAAAARMADPVDAAHKAIARAGLRKLHWGGRVLLRRVDIDRYLETGQVT